MQKALLLTLIVLAGLTFSPKFALGQGIGHGTNEWTVAHPDTIGLNLDALEAHLDFCQKSAADACLVAVHGFIVQEWYSPAYKYARMIDIHSATKSLTGLLTGMLIDDGKIRSIDEPASDFLPQWEIGRRAGVTLRHLLTMTAGVPRLRSWNGPARGRPSVHSGTERAMKLPLDFEPGRQWAYSNEGTTLLSPILEHAAGIPLAQYARERLFDPLGMYWTTLHVDEYGDTETYGGMKTTARDLARIGQLMLNRGQWNDQQIVSEEWVRRSVQPISQKEYGLLWWIDTSTESFAALGSLNNQLWVFPDLDLVAVRLQRAKPEEASQLDYRRPKSIELLHSIVERESRTDR